MQLCVSILLWTVVAIILSRRVDEAGGGRAVSHWLFIATHFGPCEETCRVRFYFMIQMTPASCAFVIPVSHHSVLCIRKACWISQNTPPDFHWQVFKVLLKHVACGTLSLKSPLNIFFGPFLSYTRHFREGETCVCSWVCCAVFVLQCITAPNCRRCRMDIIDWPRRRLVGGFIQMECSISLCPTSLRPTSLCPTSVVFKDCAGHQ